MAITAVNSANTEEADAQGRLALPIAMAGRLAQWRKGLGVLRNWKMYAEFFSPAYQQHNIARLQHLHSLGLDLAGKSVLDVGAGVGDHSLFYLHRNCRVVAVEGRAKLAKNLSKRLGIAVEVVDIDSRPEALERLGQFDLVHCYGLLYHLSDPRGFLSSASRVADLLLLETCVSLGDGLLLRRTPENSYVPSQAIHGKGCRPTRKWVFETLKLFYDYVYTTRTQPHHPEFPIDWSAPGDTPHGLTRAVFVASHRPISNTNLIGELPNKHDPW